MRRRAICSANGVFYIVNTRQPSRHRLARARNFFINSLHFRAQVVIIAPVIAGWSSLAARRAHNPKVVGSNPAPATKFCDTLVTPLYAGFYL